MGDSTSNSASEIEASNAAPETTIPPGSSSETPKPQERGIGPQNVEAWKKLSFLSVVEARFFYRNYALRMGFNMRIEYEKKFKTKTQQDRVGYIKYVCNKQGYRTGSRLDPKNAAKLEGPVRVRCKRQRVKLEERIGCEAHIDMKFDQAREVYVIVSWQGKHNHELHAGDISLMLNSNHMVREIQGLVAQLNENADSRLRSSCEVLSMATEGVETLDFLKSDMANHLSRRRQKAMKHGEATALQEYFRHESYHNPLFYYDVEVDCEERIANIFWADGRMQLDYKYFGDSIIFNTSYRTNKAYRPLGLFVGFNHHHQVSIFGAALLYDESTESFEWLFKTFLRCMNGKAPMTMFTDQDDAMAEAMRTTLPNTFHGLCTRHILHNAKRNLEKPIFAAVKEYLLSLFYDVGSEEEFDNVWRTMTTECSAMDIAKGHAWCSLLHKSRKQWSSAWVRQQFTSGMIVKHLSESCNNGVRVFLQPDQSLFQFFNHFNRTVEEKRHAEKIKDFEAKNKVPDNLFPYSPVTRLAAEQYSPSIFVMFQEQFQRIYEYLIEPCPEKNDGDKLAYSIYKQDGEGHRLDESLVVVDVARVGLSCNCRLYDTLGILCRHILKVMDMLGSFGNANMRTLPEHYIMKRWTRNAKSIDESTQTCAPSKPSQYSERYQHLCSKMVGIATRVCMDDDAYNYVDNFVDKLCKGVEKSSGQPVNHTVTGQQVVHDGHPDSSASGGLGSHGGATATKSKPPPATSSRKRLRPTQGQVEQIMERERSQEEQNEINFMSFDCGGCVEDFTLR